MRFVPSPYSYGAEEAGTAEAAAKDEAGGSWYDESTIKAIRTFFFGEESREKAEILKQRIVKYQGYVDTNFIPGAWFWSSELEKAKAQLRAVEAQAAEDVYSAQTTSVMQTALAVISILGVFVVGGMAINQFQKSRIHRATLKQIQRGG